MIIEDLQREYHTLAAQNLVPQYGWDKVNYDLFFYYKRKKSH